MTEEQAWAKALDIVGSQAEMARIVNATRQAVNQAVRASPAWCIAVEEATGISRHDLRPDIFGPVRESA